jgi:hypothetical protein
MKSATYAEKHLFSTAQPDSMPDSQAFYSIKTTLKKLRSAIDEFYVEGYRHKMGLLVQSLLWP